MRRCRTTFSMPHPTLLLDLPSMKLHRYLQQLISKGLQHAPFWGFLQVSLTLPSFEAEEASNVSIGFQVRHENQIVSSKICTSNSYLPRHLEVYLAPNCATISPAIPESKVTVLVRVQSRITRKVPRRLM